MCTPNLKLHTLTTLGFPIHFAHAFVHATMVYAKQEEEGENQNKKKTDVDVMAKLQVSEIPAKLGPHSLSNLQADREPLPLSTSTSRGLYEILPPNPSPNPITFPNKFIRDWWSAVWDPSSQVLYAYVINAWFFFSFFLGKREMRTRFSSFILFLYPQSFRHGII